MPKPKMKAMIDTYHQFAEEFYKFQKELWEKYIFPGMTSKTEGLIKKEVNNWLYQVSGTGSVDVEILT